MMKYISLIILIVVMSSCTFTNRDNTILGLLTKMHAENDDNASYQVWLICDIDKIRIKVYGKKCQYIKALPLHHSQCEVETTNNYSIFEYLLKPTYDFCQELLSHGDEIEVLSPASLKEHIKEIVENMSKYYNCS